MRHDAALGMLRSRGNIRHPQARCLARQNYVGRGYRVHLLENILLERQLFTHRLDDEITSARGFAEILREGDALRNRARFFIIQRIRINQYSKAFFRFQRARDPRSPGFG